MVAIFCVRSDYPALSAVAVCCSGSGLPVEESQQEESHIIMKEADDDM